MIAKGTKITGTNGQEYEVARDLYAHDRTSSRDFIPLNGAPEPFDGMLMPVWLVDYLKAHINDR